MSALESALDRLREAHAAASEVAAVAERTPGDRYVLANLAAINRDIAKLERKWEERPPEA